jgi:hypothetical protein
VGESAKTRTGVHSWQCTAGQSTGIHSAMTYGMIKRFPQAIQLQEPESVFAQDRESINAVQSKACGRFNRVVTARRRREASAATRMPSREWMKRIKPSAHAHYGRRNQRAIEPVLQGWSHVRENTKHRVATKNLCAK